MLEEKNDQYFLNIYPNPASTYTNLKIDLAGRTDVDVYVMDMSGRIVRTMSVNDMAQGEHELRIDLNGLGNGTYVMSAKLNNSVKSSKFVISR